MFAVFKTGGKQYKVAIGDKLRVERLDGKAGDVIQLSEILMVSENGSHKIGTPLVDKAHVKAEIVAQDRNDKIIVFKKKRRQNYRRKNGHRQDVTILKITEIKA